MDAYRICRHDPRQVGPTAQRWRGNDVTTTRDDLHPPPIRAAIRRAAHATALLVPLLAIGARAQTPDPADIADGMRIFQQKGNCQACHGWAGDGRKMDSQMPD